MFSCSLTKEHFCVPARATSGTQYPSKKRSKRAIIVLNLSNEFFAKIWINCDKQQHRIDGPARIIYRDRDCVFSASWLYKGEKHRTYTGPAYIRYFENGEKFQEEWYCHEKLVFNHYY